MDDYQAGDSFPIHDDSTRPSLTIAQPEKAKAPVARKRSPWSWRFAALAMLLSGGALSFMTIEFFGGAIQSPDARPAKVKSDFASLKTAIRTFRLTHSRWPNSLEELVLQFGNKEPELEEMPLDPWDNPYVYHRTPGRRPPFVLVSYGADGRPGGIDEDADLSSQMINLIANGR